MNEKTMEPNNQLKEFIAPYSPKIQSLAIEMRNFITEIIPEANELIWDNYNAVAMAYSKSEKLKDAFCHISVYSKHVNFGFNRGAELTGSELELKGSGKLIRHIAVNDINQFPKKEVTKLILQAVGISEEMNPELIKKELPGESIVMSISEKKLRPKTNSE